MLKVIGWTAAFVAALVIGFIVFAHPFRHHDGPPDYLDGNQLSDAVRAYAEQQSNYNGPGPVNATCSQLTSPNFTCSVVFPDLAEMTYTVTVAANGSSWAVDG